MGSFLSIQSLLYSNDSYSKVPHDTKLSKLDTLRLATSYILHLTQVLDNDELPVQTMTTPPTTIQAPNNFVSFSAMIVN